jgi:hypothetical protein
MEFDNLGRDRSTARVNRGEMVQKESFGLLIVKIRVEMRS